MKIPPGNRTQLCRFAFYQQKNYTADAAYGPRTLIFSKTGKFAPKFSQKAAISSPSSGSCPPKSLDGKASISKSCSLNSFFNATRSFKLRRKSALRSGIYNQKYFIFIVGKLISSPFNFLNVKLVDALVTHY